MLDKLSWEKLLLARFEILGLLLNKLSSTGKYSLHNRGNFQQQFQMQVSEKPKTFSRFFIAVLKRTLSSEYFRKKDESHSFSISKIIDCERGGYVNV